MDACNWTPSDHALNYILQFLRDSLIPDTDVQKRVQEQIHMMQSYPDCTNYLLYILGNDQLYEEHVRSLSGIILKNNVSECFNTISEPVLNFMKQECLRLMRDPSKDVRTSVTTLIGVLICHGKLSCWPDLIPYLCNLLESTDNQLRETALSALFKICDGYLSKRLIRKEDHNEAVSSVLSKFVILVTSNESHIRIDAMKLLNQVMQDNTEVVRDHIDTKQYLNNLLQICRTENLDEQKLVCNALVMFIENRDSVVLPHIHTIIELMLQASDNEDDELALQACEFWLAIAKLSTCREMLINYVDRLIPILLKNMKYSTYELDALRDYVGVDEHIDDKLDDIRPFNIHTSAGDDDEDYDGDFYNGDSDVYDHTDAMGEPYVGWTLRKCSAASLDALSLKLKDEMLPVFIPLLNHALHHEDYIIKESGILALGAVAEGCLSGLRQYLPQLIHFLLSCMSNDLSIVRVITCWTLSRYMPWVMEQEHAMDLYFVPVLTVILKHFVDGNKRVQRAALSAFCIFQEEARLKLVPFIGFILQAILLGLKKYKFRSYLLLYDAIGVLSHAVGNNLNKPEYANLLLPPLIQKFNSFDTYDDEHFIALTECLSSVATAFEVGFLPYAEVVFSRCLLIINHMVGGILANMENPDEYDSFDKGALYVAYDMLLGMAIGLKTYFVKFVTNSNLVQQMYYTMQDDLVQVRQSTLALYGELVKLCFSHLSPTVHNYIPIVIENLDSRFDGACNNAAWVIGKLCLSMGNDIDPYVGQILEQFLEIMQNFNGSKTMCQTVAISLCTLGVVCPDQIVSHLGTIIRPCCQAMRNVRDCDEKYIGFQGLCELVMRNPAAAVNDFLHFCDAVASWNEIRTDLKDKIKTIIVSFKHECGDNNWLSFYEQFPPMLKMRLNKLYGI